MQQKGFDENNNLTTLPAMTFGYVSTSTQYYAPGRAQVENAAYVVADTDGNAINDVNLFMPGTGTGFMWRDNTGAGAIALPDDNSPPPEYWATTPFQTTQPFERGVRYIDVNGDGKADVARGWVDAQAGTSNFGIHYNEYATSTGTYSWTATSTNYLGEIPTFAKRTSDGLVLTGGLFGDVNGDGLPDYVTSITGGCFHDNISRQWVGVEFDHDRLHGRQTVPNDSTDRDGIATCRYQRRQSRRLGLLAREQHVRATQQWERLEQYSRLAMDLRDIDPLCIRW